MSDIEKLCQMLINYNISISSVESFTVGTFASRVGSVPGVSKIYKGSLVSYQNEVKERLLNIDHSLIEEVGVVSKEVASLMCISGKILFNSDICVSFTGNAGPEPMENKPVGLVYIGISFKSEVKIYELNFDGNRQEIVNQAIDFVVKKLIKKFEVN